jgi:phage terminase large subunit-like protein
LATENFVPTKFMQSTSRYDKKKADRAVEFIQALKHGKGKWHGENFTLLAWQEQIIRDLFGAIKEDGYRQFNTAYIEICKKAGKSELAAAVALYLLVADGEQAAEIYSCASDRQQAGIVFEVCRQLIGQNETLRRILKIIPSQKRIIYPKTNSFYQALSAESYTKHGLNVSGGHIRRAALPARQTAVRRNDVRVGQREDAGIELHNYDGGERHS